MSVPVLLPLAAMMLASPQRDVQRGFTILLSGHRLPTRKALLAISPSPRHPLLKLAKNTKLPPSLRKRAILALRYFPSAETGRFLLGLFHNRKGLASYSRAALRAYVRAFPLKAVPVLKKALLDRRMQFRLTALFELGRKEGKGAGSLLQKHLLKEKSPTVKRHLRRIINRFKRFRKK